MPEHAIFAKLRSLISDSLGVDPKAVTLQSQFAEELNCDSLGLYEVLMQVEDDFSIEIPDADSLKFKTVADLVNYLEAHGAQAA